MDLILGTAGHIDHGKSSLIKALTGVDTARLPEERKRGITIELGYALLEIGPWRLGIVDVPGHEKFVRQMLAGATGMDLALLVVAADDSVKPQTREHFDILRMLRLKAGVIALTKADLVQPEWLELVQQEIRELVAGSFLEQAEIVPVSSTTGLGIDALKAAIVRSTEQIVVERNEAAAAAPFRMAIDRCFPVEGFGTVVTGTVGSGSIRVGEPVELQPQGLTARIRGLQNHDQLGEEVHRGQRAAVNLAGVHHEQVRRGDELSAPGYLSASRRMLVELDMLDGLARPLEDRTRVRLHIGTTELPAVVRLACGSELGAGETGTALLLLGGPAVATWNQPFAIRQESPNLTIGGGRVLYPDAPSIRRFADDDREFARLLGSPEPVQRVEAALWFASPDRWSPSDLVRNVGIAEPESHLAALVANGRVRELRLSSSRVQYWHERRFLSLQRQLLDRISRMHDREPLRVSHSLSALLTGAAHSAVPEILRLAIAELVASRQIVRHGETVCVEGRGPKLTRNERGQLDELLQKVRAAGLAGPTLAELQKSATKAPQSIPQLVRIAEAGGEIVLLGGEFAVHRDTLAELVKRLQAQWPPPARFTVSELRIFLDSSRKYVLPLCEYLDQHSITRRDGDWRELTNAE